MTLIQLEYVVSLDTHRNFVLAAENCFVTQPTLSMQIQKLEEELGVKIFDRSKQPVLPTEIGERIIEQAKITLEEAKKIKELVSDSKNEVSGELRLGIIPTLAPYLLPLFLNNFLKKYPLIKVKINELTTEDLTERLRKNQIDVGILVTPINNPKFKEYPLFYEEFMVYGSLNNQISHKKYVLPEDIDLKSLWLLEEGHCFRSQIINICELRKANTEKMNCDYEAGSIETLKKLVDTNEGLTILPELAVNDLPDNQRKRIRQFREPIPVREVSLITHRDYLKRKLIQLLYDEILAAIPEKMKNLNNRNKVGL